MDRFEAGSQLGAYIEECTDEELVDLFNACLEDSGDMSLTIYPMDQFDDIMRYKYNATPWDVVSSLNSSFDVHDLYFSWRGDIDYDGGIVSYSNLVDDEYSPFDRQFIVNTIMDVRKGYGDVFIEDLLADIEEE